MSKNILITGASKGIGFELAKLHLEQGDTVFGWSRTKADHKHPNFYQIEADLTTEQGINNGHQATAALLPEGQQIDVLVNNAGFGWFGAFEEMEPTLWRQMFALNVDAIFLISRLYIPEMKKRGDGHIVNISSIAGRNGNAGVGAYCGTKFAVRGLSESMYLELKDFGIRVTNVMPGAVETDFFETAGRGQGQLPKNFLPPTEVARSIQNVINMDADGFSIREIEYRPIPRKN